MLQPAVAAPTPSVVADLDPATVPWFRAERRFGDALAPQESYEIDAGFLGDDAPRITRSVDLARAADELELARPMPVAVLGDGTMLYASDDGTTSTLHLGSVANDDERETALVPGFVWAVALSPDASVAYVIQLDRATQRDAGVWAVPTDGSGKLHQVMPAAVAGVARAEFSLVASAPYTATLQLDAGGALLARTSCARDARPFACRLDVLDIASGTITRLDDDLGSGFIGLEAGIVLDQPTCFGLDPCAPVLVDLASGARQNLPWVTDNVAITLAGQRPMVAAVTHAGDGLSGLAVIDLRAGRTRQLIAERPAGITLWNDGSAVLPQGWFRIDAGDLTGQIAVRASDGKTVQLPAPPPFRDAETPLNG